MDQQMNARGVQRDKVEYSQLSFSADHHNSPCLLFNLEYTFTILLAAGHTAPLTLEIIDP